MYVMMLVYYLREFLFRCYWANDIFGINVLFFIFCSVQLEQWLIQFPNSVTGWKWFRQIGYPTEFVHGHRTKPKVNSQSR